MEEEECASKTSGATIRYAEAADHCRFVRVVLRSTRFADAHLLIEKYAPISTFVRLETFVGPGVSLKTIGMSLNFRRQTCLLSRSHGQLL